MDATQQCKPASQRSSAVSINQRTHISHFWYWPLSPVGHTPSLLVLFVKRTNEVFWPHSSGMLPSSPLLCSLLCRREETQAVQGWGDAWVAQCSASGVAQASNAHATTPAHALQLPS